MSATNGNSVCPRCGILSNNKTNRLVTDSCGHRKCRRCLLADDECMECGQEAPNNIENSALINISTEARNESDIIAAANNDEKKAVKKKGRKTATMPLHILQIQNDTHTSQHYFCTRCCRKFTSRSQQYYHLACGSDAEKKYKCQQCAKAFSTSSHLKYHLETHNENAYNCKHCNKTFTNRMVLRKHEKHHRAPTFKCTACHKEFRSNDSLVAHTRKWHDDKELPFKCTVCQKSYALKSTLKQHMQKHFDKKYACQYCDKRFQRNYTLKLHLNKHTKTDYFICSICVRKFCDEAGLQRHFKLHQDTIKYHCKECDATIVRKDNMLRHIRTIHPGQSFEDCVELTQPNSINEESEFEVVETTQAELTQTQQTIEPKTVDNSAVIKCIGNVEPMKVPTTLTLHTQPLFEANIVEHIQTDCGDTNAFAFAPIITETQQQNVSVISSASEQSAIVQKKVKKKYDPIKMYRKILATDCEDDGSVYESESEKEDSTVVAPQGPLNTVNSIEMTPSTMEKRVMLTTSNFSEMHWRKNFKYTYEYQDI